MLILSPPFILFLALSSLFMHLSSYHSSVILSNCWLTEQPQKLFKQKKMNRIGEKLFQLMVILSLKMGEQFFQSKQLTRKMRAKICWKTFDHNATLSIPTAGQYIEIHRKSMKLPIHWNSSGARASVDEVSSINLKRATSNQKHPINGAENQLRIFIVEPSTWCCQKLQGLFKHPALDFDFWLQFIENLLVFKEIVFHCVIIVRSSKSVWSSHILINSRQIFLRTTWWCCGFMFHTSQHTQDGFKGWGAGRKGRTLPQRFDPLSSQRVPPLVLFYTEAKSSFAYDTIQNRH